MCSATYLSVPYEKYIAIKYGDIYAQGNEELAEVTKSVH